MKKNTSFFRSRIYSFGFAFQGLKHLLSKEPNTKIHLVATILVIVAGFIKQLSGLQWIAMCFAIAVVWITEALNTCIEMLCDHFCNNQYNEQVKIIKDIAAAAVLIASAISVVIAIIIFTH